MKVDLSAVDAVNEKTRARRHDGKIVALGCVASVALMLYAALVDPSWALVTGVVVFGVTAVGGMLVLLYREHYAFETKVALVGVISRALETGWGASITPFRIGQMLQRPDHDFPIVWYRGKHRESVTLRYADGELSVFDANGVEIPPTSVEA